MFVFNFVVNVLQIIIAFGALVSGIETDDIDHRKRGAGKTTGVNTIPTGAQKPEHTYSIYSQNPNTQSNLASHIYQSQVPNSFYPNQASSQYYAPSTGTNEGVIAHSIPQPTNIATPQGTQFLPLNFVPSPGYQAKYQTPSSKSANGHIQLVVLQPSAGLSSSNYHFPQSVYSPTTNQLNAHANSLLTSIAPHGHFNFPTNYQPLSIASPYLGHASTVLLPQLNAPFYSNPIYPTSGQNLYYPTNSQPKHNYPQSPQALITREYNKSQGSVSQSVSKDENDISAQSSDLVQSDTIPSYKSPYTSGRSASYTKH